jgi:hypothetical protein
LFITPISRKRDKPAIQYFAEEYGYSPDSLETKKLFDTMQAQSEAIKYAAGDLFETFLDLEEE